jgi:hypothetical protein
VETVHQDDDHLEADDLAAVRLVHYRRVAAIDTRGDFAGPESVGAMLTRADLDPLDREMMRHLRSVHVAVLADGR